MDSDHFYIEHPEFDLEKACKQDGKIYITPFEGTIIFCLVGGLILKGIDIIYEKIFPSQEEPVVQTQLHQPKIDEADAVKLQNYIMNPSQIQVFKDNNTNNR